MDFYDLTTIYLSPFPMMNTLGRDKYELSRKVKNYVSVIQNGVLNMRENIETQSAL